MSHSASGRTSDLASRADLEARIAELEARLAQREQALATLNRSEEQFRTALDNMLDPCITATAVRDEDGRIVDFRIEFANELACRMSGKRRAEVIGQAMGAIDPKSLEAELFPEYCRVVESGEPLVIINQEHEELRDGRPIHFYFDLQVVKQGDGIVATWRNVTEHTSATLALQNSQERLRLGLEVNHMGFWEWPFEGTPLCSREMCHLFGIPCEEDMQYVSALEMLRAIHPDDFPAAQQMMREVIETGCDYRQVLRIVLPGGGVRWIRSQGRVHYDEQGQPEKLIGVSYDITERKRLRDELEEALSLLDGLFNSAPVGLGVWDTDLRFQRINPALAAMNGLPISEHLGRKVEDVLPGLQILDEIDALRRQVIETGEPILNYEVTGTNPVTQEPATWREHFYPIRVQDEVIAVGAIVEDITVVKQATEERERLVRELAAERARLAELTGHLEEIVAERTEQVRQLANQLTVAEQEERARISRILHDDIQQILYGIQMRSHLITTEVSMAQMDKENAAYLKENLAELARLTQDAIRVTRNLAIELNPPILDIYEVSSLLYWLANNMQELHGLETRLVLPDARPLHLMDKNRRLLLLQSVRELLFNVVKHAGTREAGIQVAEHDGVLHITVCDRGAGFDPNQISANNGKQSGLGLTTLHERLRLFRGTLSIHSEPGQGSAITIMLPL